MAHVTIDNTIVVIRVDLGDSNGEAWQYELALGHDSRQRPQIKREVVARRGKELGGTPSRPPD